MKLTILILILFARICSAEIDFQKSYSDYKLKMDSLEKYNQKAGNSYIISGAIVLLGGIIGNEISSDPTEQLAYSAFQSIGVGSIGYGMFSKSVGDEKQLLFNSVDSTENLSYEDKYNILRSYYREKAKREKKERLIKAITHGLIGALNIFSATKQDNERIQTTMYFVGGANALASITYTF